MSRTTYRLVTAGGLVVARGELVFICGQVEALLHQGPAVIVQSAPFGRPSRGEVRLGDDGFAVIPEPGSPRVQWHKAVETILNSQHQGATP